MATAVRIETPASMGRRLLARLIDMIAVATWMFALSVAHILLHLQLWSDRVAPEPWGSWFLATITFLVLYAAYEIAFISRTGSTPGKDLLGVQVIDSRTGDHPGLRQAFLRWLPYGLIHPIPWWWLLALLTGLLGGTGFADTQRRTIPDRLAGTLTVVKHPPATDEAKAARRRAFMPRLIDPFAVYRAARSNPGALRRHPNEPDN